MYELTKTEQYIADMEFNPTCDECWGMQARCDEHLEEE